MPRGLLAGRAKSRDGLVIAAGRVLTPEGDLVPGVVKIDAGRITRVRDGQAARPDVRIPRGILAPGLIDLQINGAAGVDFLTCDGDTDLAPAANYLLSTGVTAFLPTLIAAPFVQLRAALVNWGRLRERAGGSAPRILGVHLEGPYLNPKYAGAHNPDDLRRPDRAEFETLLDMAPGLVRLVTLAPELAGAEQLVRSAVRRRVVVAAGHSGATYEQARESFRFGVRLVTHLFNAMRPLRHRDPGIVTAALQDRKVAVSLIADLVHLHPAIIRMVLSAVSWRRAALITDAVAAAGTARRMTSLGGRQVTVTDAPRLADGRLAGSVLSLDQAIRNLVALGIPARDAILMASQVPAVILGRRDLGRIAIGAQADFVIFDPALRVRAVYVAGALAYSRSQRRNPSTVDGRT